MVADELSQNKARSTLALARCFARAAEEAALHRDKLGIARKVTDVARFLKRYGPKKTSLKKFSKIGFIIGEVHPVPPEEGETGKVVTGPRSS
jgi:hypothetical protein